jgi:hypothetical protein
METGNVIGSKIGYSFSLGATEGLHPNIANFSIYDDVCDGFPIRRELESPGGLRIYV